MELQRIGSVMKDPSRSTENLAYNLKKYSSVIVPDGLDGWNGMYFAFKGHDVTIYESNPIFIHGGEINLKEKDYKIHGLRKRMKAYKVEDIVHYEEKNFYENVPNKKYDLVYANRTLNRECNAHITIEDKLKSLISVVKEGGEVYLHYLMAIDEDDYENYPSNLYPRVGQVPKFFDNDDWEIILLRERFKVRPEKGHFGNPELHYHKYGYVYARRNSRSNRLFKDTHKYHFNICIGKI